MGRDLISRPYGRFFYLPLELAKLGHAIDVITFNFRPAADETLAVQGMRWHSISLAAAPWSVWRRICQVARVVEPDWVIGCSDIWFGLVAARLARKFQARVAIDAYDNFEAYLPYAKPLHWAWRHAIAEADLVTVAGPSLQDQLGQNRADRLPVIIPMAPDPSGFFARDRFRARAGLGLDPTRRYIGYAGSIARSRGIEQLFEAYDLLQRDLPDISLLLSGRLEHGLTLPPGTQYLGYVADAVVPQIINSLDVMVIVNRASNFGHFSYPIKLYEAMQCGLPVVVSRTRSTEWVLREHPELLVDTGDPNAIVASLNRALALGSIDYAPLPTWAQGALEYQRALLAAD